MLRSYRLLLILLSVLFHTTYAQTIDKRFVDGQVFIRCKDSVTINLVPYDHTDQVLNSIYTQFGIDTIIRPFPGLNDTLDRTYKIRFHQYALVDSLINSLKALPYIEYVEKPPLEHITTEPFFPNDLQSSQYQLSIIYAPYAWAITMGDTNIVIAIVDNAVRITHSDLIHNIWNNPNPGGPLSLYPNDYHGWDVADNDNNPNPPAYTTNSSPFSHGTHCTGIADATTDNNLGIASIGYNVRIMAVKCTSDTASDSGASLTDAFDGVYYATQAGANIISMSWGDSSGSQVDQNLINAAYTKGIILLAAAGNSNSNAPFYPAAYTNVLAVGATGQTDAKASYSNYGNYIGVMAPGTNIYSTVAGSDSSYGFLSGTSMACPLTAGLAALVLSTNPSLSNDEVVAQIENNCDDIDSLNPNYVGMLGYGRINAARTLGANTGIAKISENNNLFRLAPNPNNGQFNLYWSGAQPLDDISVIDYTGRELLKQQAPAAQGSKIGIQLNALLPAGVYFLKAMSAGQEYVCKFMVE